MIGRNSRPIFLTDHTVSRQHAKLLPDTGKWMLEDLGSANGTYLNGVKVTRPQEVHRGDQIRCGSTLLVFSGGRARKPHAPVDLDEDGSLVDAAIVATVPSNEDSIIIPTPEAGAEAIGNLRSLYDLIVEIGSIFNIDALVRRTLDKIFEVVHADRGYILLMEENGKGPGPLTLRASRVSDGKDNQKAAISQTIINEVITKHVGVLSSNAMSDKRFTSGKSVHDFGIRSAICVPIRGRQTILGIIHVDCSVSDQTYSTEQLRLLTAIGYQAGLAIENARLYEATVQSERLAATGETVAFLSHHIKNILQALGGGIDVVESALNKGDAAKAKENWPIVQRNLGRINELILNMLAFSKDRQPLLENVNVNHVLTECLELMGPRADERGVALMSELDEQPPIPADASGLSQAFMNLIANALDAVPDKTGVITVSSKYDSMNRNVIVQVIDNGQGIDPVAIDKIFTPFYSAKGQRGTGLGLAVTQKVVQEHQGTITVKSALGAGTTFTLTLPALHKTDSSDTAGPGK